MATSLSPSQRAQLDGIVQKMQASGESDAYIQGVVNDFKTKYSGAPATATRQDIMNAIPTAIPGVSAGQLAGIAPQALGFTGGAVGGPGGAAMGGTLGELARQALMEDQMDPRKIVTEGLGQGALQGIGSGVGMAARSIGPLATRAAAMAKNPIAKRFMRLGRVGLPLGGAVSGGIPGAVVGAALPYAGRAAMSLATSPRVAALLASPMFQQLAKQSPRAAGELVKEAMAADGQ